MELHYINPFELKPNAWNTNKVSRPEFEKLKASLTRLGAFKPATVRKLDDGSLEILGGFHRIEAAKELGWTKVPVTILTGINDQKAKEISVVDNTRYGKDDQELLEKLLAEMEDTTNLDIMLPDETVLELPVSPVEAIEEVLGSREAEARKEPEKGLGEPKEETHKTLHYKFEIEKAEEIEAVLSEVAYEFDYKYSDGYANFADALYHILVLKRK